MEKIVNLLNSLLDQKSHNDITKHSHITVVSRPLFNQGFSDPALRLNYMLWPHIFELVSERNPHDITNSLNFDNIEKADSYIVGSFVMQIAAGCDSF